jgi:hypothetical protein
VDASFTSKIVDITGPARRQSSGRYSKCAGSFSGTATLFVVAVVGLALAMPITVAMSH